MAVFMLDLILNL